MLVARVLVCDNCEHDYCYQVRQLLTNSHIAMHYTSNCSGLTESQYSILLWCSSSWYQKDNNIYIQMYSNYQLQKYTMDCRKEAGTVIVVKVLVFAHIINLLPLSLRHLFLHQFWRHFFLIWVKTTILPNNAVAAYHQQHLSLCSEFIL